MGDGQVGTALRARAMAGLPLGAIRPDGWLLGQLRIQAEGLSGHLDEFWPDVARSAWIGGDRDGWERGPYWLDGLIPLAVALDDTRLMTKAQRWVDAILAGQHADGWLGSAADRRIRSDGSVDLSHDHDPWPRFVVLKALTQWQEATGDPRVVPALSRFLARLAEVLAERRLRSWGRYRWADLLVSIAWLHERTGKAWLLELAQTVQAQGFDWAHHAVRFPVDGRSLPEERDLSTHVVNNAMGVKSAAVWSRFGGPDDAIPALLEALDRWHGQANGTFSGDEHLAGHSPSQGTELCAVVELMYSLETMMAVTGEAVLGDRLERTAYNALPATFAPDMWSHQYVQQVNQVQCITAQDRVYTSNGPDANTFGLDPHFGCCLANMHQGWPKFTSSLWMRTPEGGLAAVAWAPCTVTTEVDGLPVRIEVRTAYPFNETIAITVTTEAGALVPLTLRVPEWANGATITVGDTGPVPVEPGTFHRLTTDGAPVTRLALHFTMPLRTERRDDGSVCLYRGPLLFAHPLGEDWRQTGGELPHADWELRPTSPWAWGLVAGDDAAEIAVREPGPVPFSPDGSPVRVMVRAQSVAGWELARNAAGPVPVSPARANGPEIDLPLIPYGATNLRIAQFPVVEGAPGED